MKSSENLFGVQILDACIKTSLRNHLVFIAGPSGSGKSMLVKSSVASYLESGGGALVVLLDEDLDTFLDTLTHYTPPNIVMGSLREGRLKIIDSFSYRLRGLTETSKRGEGWGVREADPSNPSTIIDVSRILLEDLRSRGLESVVVIDSLNEIMTSSDPVRTAEFIKLARALYTRVFKYLTLVTIHLDSDMINNWFREYSYIADGIVVMDTGADQEGRVYRYIQVRKFRASEHCQEPIVYKVDGGRIVA